MSSHPRSGDFRITRRKVLPLAAAFGLFAGLLVAPARRAEAQIILSSGVRISQVYTRGGEPGAAFNRDFIELFNAGPSTVDLNGWSFHITGVNGSPNTSVVTSVVSSRGILLEPGRYLLLSLSGGPDGAAVPSPDFELGFSNNLFNLLPERGQIALLRRGAPALPAFTCPQLPIDGVEDYVGYGAAACREGNAAAPAPTLTHSIKRAGQGCTDTDNNATDFALAPADPRGRASAPFNCSESSGPSMIHFAIPEFAANELDGRAQIMVSRTGDLSGAVSVEYFTADGTAWERRDYTTAAGTLRFAPGEQSKTFDVLINGDAYAEGTETVSLVLLNPTGGAALGPRPLATLVIHDGPVFTPAPSGNPVDATPNFVEQHYHDFLNRKPDEGGLRFWSQGVESCGANAQCRQVKRVDTSAAFFLSIEFQETGYFVYRLYKASLPARQLRPRAMPRYREFVRDTQEVGRGVVVGLGDWRAQLDANRRAFLEAFVARPEFQEHYPASLTPAEYVQKLNQQAGGVLSPGEAAGLVAGLVGGTETRATVLGRVADDPDFVRAELNRAFVLMQYFGYLRRDPDDVGFNGQPDPNFNGYDFWLAKLNEHGGDYRRAEMVRAFIESIEYRQRFGQ